MLFNIINTQNIPTSGQQTNSFVLLHLSKLLVCPVSKIAGGTADPSAGLCLLLSTPYTALALITVFAFSTLACLKPHWPCLRLPGCLVTCYSVYTQAVSSRAAQCCLCRASSLGNEAHHMNCFWFVSPLLFAFSIMHGPIICQGKTYSRQDALTTPTVFQHSSIYLPRLHQSPGLNFRQTPAGAQTQGPEG